MTTDPFSDPAQPVGIDYNELQGCLLLFEVVSREDGVRTRMDQPGDPPRTAMAANVYVLDGPRGGGEFQNALIFPKVLVNQLRPKVGQWVLGRLAKGEARSGLSAPWQLAPTTDQDKALARQWFARRQGGGQAPPASSYQPPAQQPYAPPAQPPIPAQQQGQLPLQGQEPPF